MSSLPSSLSLTLLHSSLNAAFLLAFSVSSISFTPSLFTLSCPLLLFPLFTAIPLLSFPSVSSLFPEIFLTLYVARTISTLFFLLSSVSPSLLTRYVPASLSLISLLSFATLPFRITFSSFSWLFPFGFVVCLLFL